MPRTEDPTPFGAPAPAIPAQPVLPIATESDLSGRVVNAFGRPEPGASLQVLQVNPVRKVVAEVASAADGTFRVRNLQPRTQYEVLAYTFSRGQRDFGRVFAATPDNAIVVQVDREDLGTVSPSSSQSVFGQRGSTAVAGPSWRNNPPPTANGFTIRTPAMIGAPIALGPESPTVGVGNSPAVGAPASGFAPPASPAGSAQPLAPPNQDWRPLNYLNPQDASPPFRQTASRRPVGIIDSRLGALSLPDVNGEPVTLANVPGKIFLLDFFGSWCGPCRRSIPKLNRLHEKYARSGLTIVGVACENGTIRDAIAEARRARQELNIAYPVLVTSLDEPSEIRDRFAVKNFPTLVLLNRDGRVLAQGAGAGNKVLAQIDQICRAAR